MCFLLIFFSAENLKRQFDKEFGPPWNVVVGETYTCDIDYDSNFLYQFLYGPVAVLAWRVRIFPYYWFLLPKILLTLHCLNHCTSDLKNIEKSWSSASNFKIFSQSLEQLFLTVGQNNYCNKIPFPSFYRLFIFSKEGCVSL